MTDMRLKERQPVAVLGISAIPLLHVFVLPFALCPLPFPHPTMPKTTRTQQSSNRDEPPSKPNTRKRGDSGPIAPNKKPKMDDENESGEETAAVKPRAKGKGRRQKAR
jgi:hypothetical protein